MIPGGIVDAVTKWRFTPAMKNGVATAVRLDLEFSIVPSRTQPSAFNAGAGVSMPTVISKVEPTYSPEALKAKLIGSESLQVIVGVDGSARNFRVMKGLGLGLDEAAIVKRLGNGDSNLESKMGRLFPYSLRWRLALIC